MDSDFIVTPDGFRYDLTYVHQAESRTHEIAIVTPTKAPELLSVFNRACFVLGRYLRELYKGVEKAKKAREDRKAVLIIDVIPAKLKARDDLADNADTRKAFYSLDPEYSALSDQLIEWEATLLYVQRKLKDMESNGNAVKKVLHDTGDMYKRPNYNVLDNDSTPPPATSPTTTTPGGLKLGKPRY